MRIDSAGIVMIGTTNTNPAENNVKGVAFYQDGRQFISSMNNEVMRINRGTSDGVLVFFHQAGVAEGNISVSGTTVSYNGGHLARYSQTESYIRIEGLLKGTVMSNLDKMAEWINPETGEPYPNEQLNCMKISDVEGDINVAGVFVDWDDDDIHFLAEIHKSDLTYSYFYERLPVNDLNFFIKLVQPFHFFRVKWSHNLISILVI
jgi:hypothetical protein